MNSKPDPAGQEPMHGSQLANVPAPATYALLSVAGALLAGLLFVLLSAVFRMHPFMAIAVCMVAFAGLAFLVRRSFAHSYASGAHRVNWREQAIPALLFCLTAAYTLLFHYRMPFYDHWDMSPCSRKRKPGACRLANCRHSWWALACLGLCPDARQWRGFGHESRT